MPPRATLVLADRPAARPALVALAGAVEGSALSSRVALVLARGPAAVAQAARRGRSAGDAVAVAWSFYSADAAEVARELARARADAPTDVLHLAGGVHATAEPEATLGVGFDLVARGEGEETILAVLARLLADEDPRAVPGLAWREGGRTATSGRAAPVRLDDHPASSRRLGKALALEVTRGCVWACRFCQTPFLQRARFRHRSVAAAREWVRHAVELGHRDLRFLTPSALSYGAEGPEVRLEAVEELLGAVRAEVGPSRRIFVGSFPSEIRPEHVSSEALAVLRRFTDNRELLVGAQSAAGDTLARRASGPDRRRHARAAAAAGVAGPRVRTVAPAGAARERSLGAARPARGVIGILAPPARKGAGRGSRSKIRVGCKARPDYARVRARAGTRVGGRRAFQYRRTASGDLRRRSTDPRRAAPCSIAG